MWHFTIVMPYQICQDTWWASFLYITNYFFDSVRLIFLLYYLLNEMDKGKKLTQYITLYSLIMMTKQLQSIAHIKRYLSKFHFFYP